MFDPIPFMATKHILAYGEDVLVISTRAMILRRAGYGVVYTTSAADLVPLLQSISFDLLLIGDSLRTSQNVRIVQQAREEFPTLMIATVQDEKEERDPWSTAFVTSTPEQMLSSIELLLEANRKPVASNVVPSKLRAMQSAAGR
jgi:DNA-binding NtrC family response regulator